MNAFFWERVIPMALVGSVIVLLVWLIQIVLVKHGKSGFGVWAWLFTALFFILYIPISNPSEATLQGAPVLNNAVAAASQNLQMVSDSVVHIAAYSPAASFVRLIPGIWFVGVIVCALRFILQNIRLTKLLKAHRQKYLPLSTEKIAVFTLPQIRSPFACSLIHPSIYLSDDLLQSSDLLLILKHEQIHIRQGHLWANRFVQIICILYWFCPAVFLLKRSLSTACEISCDTKLTNKMTSAERKNYAALLLQRSSSNLKAPISGLSQSGKQLKYRIFALRSDAKPAPVKQAAILILIMAGILPLAQNTQEALQSAAASIRILSSAQQRIEQFLPKSEGAEGSNSHPEQIIALEWPVSEYRYCSRKQSTGFSIAANIGTEITAAADGVVLAVSNEEAFGQTIVLAHSVHPDVSTNYSHCAELYVKPGDTVRKGQVIGTVGTTGAVSGAMCRYQIQIDDEVYNPEHWHPNK